MAFGSSEARIGDPDLMERDRARASGPPSEADGDAAEDPLGRVGDGHLVEDAAFGRLVEQVPHREQDVPVRARERAEERAGPG